MKNRYTLFAKRLVKCLEDKGISQKVFAKLMRTTQQTVSRWCKGICEPEFNDLMLMCAYFEETPEYMLGIDVLPIKQYLYDILRDIAGNDKNYQKEQMKLNDKYMKGKSVIALEEMQELEKEQQELFDRYFVKYCEEFKIENNFNVVRGFFVK